VRAGLYDGLGTTPEDIPFGGKLTETGRWTTFTDVPITQGNVRLFFAGLDASDSFSFNSTEGDKFYIADVSVDEVNDATQTTADNQPLIVSAGALVEENGKAAVEFSGNPVYLDASNAISDAFTGNSVYQKFEVAQVTSTSKGGILSADTGYRGFFNPPSYDYANFHNPNGLEVINTLNVDRTNQFLFSESFDANTGGGTYELYGNGLLERSQGSEGTSNLDTPTSVHIGRDPIGGNSAYLVGKIQEIIFFDSDQSSNRTGIEGNIGRYYNIDGFRDVFVTKWYDQSGNFNHAENSTETEQPQIVDGGSVITEGTTPKAAVDFTAVNGLRSSVNFGSDTSIFSVFKNADNQGVIYSGTNIGSDFIYAFRTNTGGIASGVIVDATYKDAALQSLTNQTSVLNAINTGSQLLWSSFLSSVDTARYSDLSIGAGVLGDTDIIWSEIILFDSDQSANRTDIENNINKHFKIYEE
jgi:hypothetical protein